MTAALHPAPAFPNDTALLTVAQMELADRLTVAAGVGIETLMDHAGRCVAEEIKRRYTPARAVVLCGPGNNGGDGYVTARYLALAGWTVRVAALVPRERLRGAAAHHAALWSGAVAPLEPAALDDADLVVDALFGAGLSRALDGAAAQTLQAVAARRLPMVAVDVPSGLMGDTGVVLGAVPARLTVTFFRKKPGHLLQPGRALCGELVVSDIGTVAQVWAPLEPQAFENEPVLWSAALPGVSAQANKYTRGHALVSGGSPVTGASRLAARAAARIGAGLTTIAVPVDAWAVYASALTSIMVSPIRSPDDFERLLADRRSTGLLIGPGAGVGPATRARSLAMLATGRPTVLDADALTSVRDDPETLFRSIVGPCVMTPHDGEFARLFDVGGDKLTRTRNAARRSGAVVVLKGSDTVIACADGRAVINANAPATLATAGSGDVLCGIVLGLLTQGMEPFLAAAAAVWMHGAAAQAYGPGLLAEDLPDLLPGVLRRLLESARPID